MTFPHSNTKMKWGYFGSLPHASLLIVRVAWKQILASSVWSVLLPGRRYTMDDGNPKQAEHADANPLRRNM